MPRHAARSGSQEKRKAEKRHTSTLKSTLFITSLLIIVLAAVAAFVRRTAFSSGQSNELRLSKSNISDRIRWDIQCEAEDYQTIVPGCTPSRCARLVYHNLIDEHDLEIISRIPRRVMELTPGGAGGPTIFDIHTGALSYKEKFVDAYQLIEHLDTPSPLSMEDLAAVERMVNTVRNKIGEEFEIDPDKLYLTSPTFFSKIRGGVQPRTLNDEYWHEHVDKAAYGRFVYTSLLYLSDYGTDFTGGEFAFIDKKVLGDGKETVMRHVIEPSTGRVSIFTSASENVHKVEKVLNGTRYALTIAFTCDEQKGIVNFLDRAKRVISNKLSPKE